MSIRLTAFSLAFFILPGMLMAQTATVGQPLPAWQKGYLDLHHINTGRGNAAFYIFPDGTTMLFDAGEIAPTDPRTFTPRNAVIKPNYDKYPYEWIAAYIWQVAPKKQQAVIDYAAISHFHDDHFGNWYRGAPLSASGRYVLSGITGVGDLIPIKLLLDRGFPLYDYPYNMKKYADQYSGETDFGKTAKNYFDFIAFQRTKGMRAEMFRAGTTTQISLRYDRQSYPDFYVQHVKANEKIWTGKDSTTTAHFQAPDTTNRRSLPDENSLSLALTLHYGPFIYYTGGDNPGNVFTGDHPLRDVETPIARAVGEVDVATMDHHGNRDAVNEFQVKTMKPRVWIGQSWSSDHPGHEVLIRMTNPNIYSEPRDLFATNMLDANRYVIGPLIDKSYKSQQGHILVRVLPGGNTYYVIILDDSKVDFPVKSVWGPYTSKVKK